MLPTPLPANARDPPTCLLHENVTRHNPAGGMKVCDLPEAYEIHFRVHAGRRWIPMPEMIANLLHREALVKEPRGAGMTQRVGTVVGEAKTERSARKPVQSRVSRTRLLDTHVYGLSYATHARSVLGVRARPRLAFVLSAKYNMCHECV